MTDDFTIYDYKPKDFLNYLRYNGNHFNRKLCQFACKLFDDNYISKEMVQDLLKDNLEIDMNNIYDIVYIANWCRYIFYSSSIPDEQHLILFIKDVMSKESDLIFNRWYADCAKRGISIDWYEMI